MISTDGWVCIVKGTQTCASLAVALCFRRFVLFCLNTTCIHVFFFGTVIITPRPAQQ